MFGRLFRAIRGERVHDFSWPMRSPNRAAYSREEYKRRVKEYERTVPRWKRKEIEKLEKWLDSPASKKIYGQGAGNSGDGS